MRVILKFTKLIILIGLISLVSGCNETDNTRYISGNNSLVNYIENHAGYTLFLEAIERVDRYHELDGNSGDYTLLLPDDRAMQIYLDSLGKELSEFRIPELNNLIDYHLLDTRHALEGLVTGYLPTLAAVAVNDSLSSNLSLLVKSELETVIFNGRVNIVEADIPLDNGVLHKIDGVLALPTLKTFLEADENLSPFYRALMGTENAAEYEELINRPRTKSTFLVPSAFAMEQFFEHEEKTLTATEKEQLFKYHILVDNTLLSTVTGGYLPTLAEEGYSTKNYALPVYLGKEEGVLLNGKARVELLDLMTINGNIQVLGSVLTPPSTLEFLKADPEFTGFYQLLEMADAEGANYRDLLAKTGAVSPFTVFAPTNAEVEKLVENFFPEEENPTPDKLTGEDLKGIINLHILEKKGMRSTDFTTGSLTMKSGHLILDAAEKSLTDPVGQKAQIGQTNIQTKNGVLHKIDKVLLPKIK